VKNRKTNGNRSLESQKKIEMAVDQQRLRARLLCEALGWKFYPVLKKNNFIGYCLTPSGIVPIELKVRKTSSNTWPTILIEQKMVNSLKKRAKHLGYLRCFYAEFYEGDNTTLYFDISTAPFEWVVEDCNINTLDGGKKTKKIVSFLDKSFATKVDFRPRVVEIETGERFPGSFKLF